MSAEENKAVVQRLYDGLFNRGRLAVADELVAVECVSHALPGAPNGPEGLRRVVALLHAAFPDGRYVLEDLIAEEDRVAARLVFHGTHRGPFRGLSPTGRRVEQAQMHILRLAAGRVVEHWAVRDDMGLRDDLARDPLPGPPAGARPSRERPAGERDPLAG